jgi:predicted HD superfamily hydrolase involved in NAD metabolism
VWGVPSDKVFVATLLHDCMKDVDFVHKGVPEDTFGTLVMHAFNGAMEAKINYGIEYEDILNAIRYHTTCRPQMSKLEKLVYLADMIEPSRVYPDLDAIRQIAYRDAEQGFLAAFGSAYKHINNSIKNIYPLTIDAYKYYFKGENS